MERTHKFIKTFKILCEFKKIWITNFNDYQNILQFKFTELNEKSINLRSYVSKLSSISARLILIII